MCHHPTVPFIPPLSHTLFSLEVEYLGITLGGVRDGIRAISLMGIKGLFLCFPICPVISSENLRSSLLVPMAVDDYYLFWFLDSFCEV